MTTIAPVDISNFMAWWINQVARIFLYVFTTLDNIQFAGTSLLRIIVFVIILSALVNIMITTPDIIRKGIETSTRKKHERSKHDNESK